MNYFQPVNVADIYAKADAANANSQNMQINAYKLKQAQDEEAQNTAADQVYKSSVNPDGTIDHKAVISGLQGLGMPDKASAYQQQINKQQGQQMALDDASKTHFTQNMMALTYSKDPETDAHRIIDQSAAQGFIKPEDVQGLHDMVPHDPEQVKQMAYNFAKQLQTPANMLEDKQMADFSALQNKPATQAPMQAPAQINNNFNANQQTPTPIQDGNKVSPEQSSQFLSTLDSKYGLPSGTLYGVLKTESNGVSRPNTQGSGADGFYQFMPATAKQFGVKTGDFASEANGAGQYLSQLMANNGGDINKALASYGGFVTKSPANYQQSVNNFAAQAQSNSPTQVADNQAPANQIPSNQTNNQVTLPYTKEQIQAGLFSPNAKIQSMSKIMQAENDKYAQRNEYGTSVSYDENNQGFVMDKNGNPKFIGVSKASDKNSVNSVPSGYMVDPEDPNALVYKKGGPADPELKAHAPIGNRESVFINRVATSANETAKDLANIVRQPLTVDRGLFGGRVQGGSLFSASAETLTNKMTSQDVQSYNVLASGIQRNLASIEAAGLSPSGSLTHQMDAMTFKDGDTNFTKLQKLAQIKQIAQAGLETTLSNPRLPKEQVAHFKDIIAQIDKAVPFNNGDLLDLQSQQQVNPEITINDILKSKQENAQPKASVKFNAPPDPSKYVGKTIRDDATGILLKSNGKTWLQVK